MSRKSDTNLQARLTNLKNKQDKWMKERNISLTSNEQTNSPKPPKTKNPNTQLNNSSSVKKKPSETLLWKNTSGGTSTEFVVRRNSPRVNTNQSIASSKSGNKNRPTSARSGQNFVKSKGVKPKSIEKEISPIKIEEDSFITNDDSISDDETIDLSTKINKYLSTAELPNPSVKNNQYGVNGIPEIRSSSPETLSSHLCPLCQSHMLSPQHAPHLIIPCAHSFCFSCVNREKFCPTCRVNIMSVQKNAALHEIIKQYEKEKQKKLEERRKEEVKKYFAEYNSIETRADLMKVEAAEIIDSMEDITNELIEQRNNIGSIEDTAASIKQQITNLQEKLKTLENEHLIKNEQCNQLEEDYAKKKKQLLLTEKTLKTLQDSKDRIKILIQSLYPSYEFEDADD